MPRLKQIGFYALVAVVVLMAVAMLKGWYEKPATVTPVQFTPAQPIKETVKIKTVKVPGPKEIVTVEKPIIVEKLKLPDEIAKDPAKQITATAEVPPYEGETHAIAITDTQSGQSHIELKQEPLPLFSFKNDKEIGIRGGVGINGYSGDLYGRWTFARVGKFHIAAYGEMSGNQALRPDAKAMLEISYRWK